MHAPSYDGLQQHLPLAVCGAECETAEEQSDGEVHTSQVPERREGKTKMMKQQYLPFTVLKRHTVFCIRCVFRTSCNSTYRLRYWNSFLLNSNGCKPASCNNTYRLRYWNIRACKYNGLSFGQLELHLPLAVCAEGCETAEEQSDDEVRTSQVPEQSEGKTKVMKQQYLLFTVLKRNYQQNRY